MKFLLLLLAAVSAVDGATVRRTRYHPDGENFAGTIRYHVVSSANNSNIQIPSKQLVGFLKTAMSWIEENTCVKFEEVFDEKSANLLAYKDTSRNGNCATIGVERIVLNCEKDRNEYSVMHELFHALGLYHEQSRFDREKFVHADASNSNNRLLEESSHTTFGLPYDYSSISHYGFAPPSLYPLDPDYNNTLGGSYPSFLDYFGVNLNQGCLVKCSKKQHDQCFNQGYAHPNDCGRCVCPSGFTGKFCEEEVNECGSSLKATAEWQDALIQTTDGIEASISNAPKSCNSRIEAPEDKSIEVRYNSVHSTAYGWGFRLEIKANDDFRAGGVRVVQPTKSNPTLVSYQSVVHLISTSTTEKANHSISFRYVPKKSPKEAPEIPCLNLLDDAECATRYGATAERPNLADNCSKQRAKNENVSGYVHPDFHVCAKFCNICPTDMSEFYPTFKKKASAPRVQTRANQQFY